MSTTYLHHLVRYNNWANRGLLEFVKTLPPEAVDAGADGVYGTIRETFEHIFTSELSYHRNLAGLPRASQGERDANPPIEVLEQLASESAGRLEGLVEILPEPGQMMELRDGRRAASTILVQLFAHGCEHRAQIGTILGARGILGPELDGWAYGIFAGGDDWPADWGPRLTPMPAYPPPGLD